MKPLVILWYVIMTAMIIDGAEISPIFRDLNNRSLTFYAGFNNETLEPDVAAGIATALAVPANPRFEKGVYGRALFLGKGDFLIFRREGNMPLASEMGTVCFWIKPTQWDLTSDKQQAVYFFKSSIPYSGLNRQGLVRRDDGTIARHVQVMYYSNRVSSEKQIKNISLAAINPNALKNDEWALFCLTWTPSEIKLSINDSVPQGVKLASPITPDETASKDSSFTFMMESGGILDEIMIFNRILNSDEIADIYNRSILLLHENDEKDDIKTTEELK